MNEGLEDLYVEIEVVEEPLLTPQDRRTRDLVSLFKDMGRAKGIYPERIQPWVTATPLPSWMNKSYYDAQTEALDINSLGLYTKSAKVEKVTNYMQQDAMATYGMYEHIKKLSEDLDSKKLLEALDYDEQRKRHVQGVRGVLQR